MEYFNTLVGSVNTSTDVVTLTWPLNQVPGATAIVLQRAPYGSGNFTTVGTGLLNATSTTDNPGGNGDYTYRLAVTTPLGSVDGLGTTVYSNNVNISTSNATGILTLSVTTTPSVEAGFTRVTLSWADADIAGADLRFDLNRVIGSTIRFFERVAGTQFTYTEELPTGSGPQTYQVVAVLPPEGIGSQRVITTSNNVTVTI